MSLPRIYFHASSNNLFRSAVSLPFVHGTIPNSPGCLGDLTPSFSLTGNRGNLVHAEAPQKLIRFNHSRSVSGNITHQFKALGHAAFAEFFNKHFDYIILSLANFIRPKTETGPLLEALECLEVPLIVLGAGIQSEATQWENLTTSTQNLLTFFEKKATLFGVRGDLTLNTLKRWGLGKNARSLGCPSLYVYPQSIRKMTGSKTTSQYGALTTAGHLSANNLRGGYANSGRARALLKAFSGHTGADYVFQDEIFSFEPLLSKPLVFDGATQQLSLVELSLYFRAEFGAPPPFARFFFFNDTPAWRQYFTSRDAYIGDRFHCGVVALQAGVPSVFVTGDARIAELTAFFQLPVVSYDELRTGTIQDALSAALKPGSLRTFEAAYSTRYEQFADCLAQLGLELAQPSPQLQ